MTAPESVDAYLAAQPDAVRDVLERIRRIVHETVPGAGETIAYGMPTATLDGRSLVHWAGWAKHVSVYPEPDPADDPALAQDLAPYANGRGTLKFRLDRPVPYDLVGRVVTALAARHGR